MDEFRKKIAVDFSQRQSPRSLSDQLYKATNDSGWDDFLLVSVGPESAYPNTCVPIAGIIDHYRRLGFDIKCDWEGDRGSYIAHTRTHNPFTVDSADGKQRIRRPFDVVWKFDNPADIYALVEASRNEVCEHSDVEEGVLTGIEWCLNEMMDNVLQHSDASYGYFMGQYQPMSKRLSLCVYDNGMGIFNSLRGSKHAPRSALDALTKALQERVTRDDSIGQGNGMWGFSEIVQSNGGNYVVSSNGARIVFDRGEVSHYEKGGFFYASEKLGTTLIDFQLDCTSSIDIAHSLKHDPTRLWLENMEGISGDEYVVKLSEISEGTGTRRAAERIRHIVGNTLREGKKLVALDFEGVNVVSSSYADELIGKLVIEIGFSAFSNYCQLRNLSTLNQRVIDRSVQQRMAQEYYDEPLSEEDEELTD